MMLKTSFLFLTLLSTALAQTPARAKVSRQEECLPCDPEGASDAGGPALEADLTSLYVDVLETVKDINFRKRSLYRNVPRLIEDFCCQSNLDCVTVVNYNLAICYDKFTTHYAFPDGSWGSLTDGTYTTSEGTADLINGNYTKTTGETGDIYAAAPEDKPNTATLSIPPQWTATGVGPALQPTEMATFVTDAPAFTGTVEESNPDETGGLGPQVTQGSAPPSAASASGPGSSWLYVGSLVIHLWYQVQ